MNLTTSRYKPELWVAVHFIIGIVLASSPGLSYYLGLLVFLSGLGLVLFSYPNNFNVVLIAGYLCGFELVARMSRSGLPHEFIKYAVALLLLITWARNGMRWHIPIAVYFLLLIPGIFLSDGGNFEETRQLISANLSGPLCLTICVLYFHSAKLNSKKLIQLFQFLLYPLVSILAILIVKTPDLSAIDFGYESNFETSIYGPNQISSILGLGILIIGFTFFFKLSMFGSSLTGLVLAMGFTFRGLLTFSRGGILTALITLAFIYVLINFSRVQSSALRFRTIGILLIFVAVGYGVFQYANDLTGNALYDRYAGIKRGEKLGVEDYTSGRALIGAIDMEIFKDNILVGTGVGMSKFLRVSYGYSVPVNAHIEYTRLLAEHGILGFIVLLVLILLPVIRFFQIKNLAQRALILLGAVFCFAFMSHAATRIAAPMFLYGLSFVTIVALTTKHDSLLRK